MRGESCSVFPVFLFLFTPFYSVFTTTYSPSRCPSSSPFRVSLELSRRLVIGMVEYEIPREEGWREMK